MDNLVPGMEIKVASKEDIWQVRELALNIFPLVYEKIVVAGQVEYMMDLFYTPEALVKQLESGQIFLIANHQGQPAGFASYTRLNAEGDFRLNKIYLDFNKQGKGLGRSLLLDVISRVRTAHGRSLRLNVNRLNKAKDFYQKMGFKIVKKEILDIGGGHYMDDYVMELNLDPKK